MATRVRAALDAWLALALVALGVGLPLLVAVSLHALGVPRNDDFAYRGTVLLWARTGHLHIVPWGAMTLVGQLAWALPLVDLFGAGSAVPVLAMAPLCALGVVAAYYLARAGLRRPLAVGCLLLALAAPGFLVNSATFMTDVPAWAAQMCCLALGWAVFKHRSRWAWVFLAGSLVVGVFAFTIRDFGAAAPAAVLLCVWLSGRLHRAAVAAAAVAMGLACFATYLLTRHLGVAPTTMALPASHELFVLGAECFTLAFFLLPALALAAARLRRLFSWPALVAGVVTLVAGLKIESVFKDVFLGNLFDQKGALPIELGPGRPALFPQPLWDLFNVVALGAGALMAGVAVTVLLAMRPQWPRGDSLPTLLGTFSIAAAAPVAAYCLLVRNGSFDRYTYPLVLPLAILMVRPWTTLGREMAAGVVGKAPPGRALVAATWAGGAWLSVLLMAGAATMVNSDAYDRALWVAGRQAVAMGAPAKTVFDGFTWEGSYQGMHLETLYCAQVSNIVLHHSILFRPFRLEAVVHWQDLGFAVPERLLVFGIKAPGCPGH